MTTFQDANGSHSGFRRHAEGACVSSWFESSGPALAGGMPFQADMLATVRSPAWHFLLAGAAEWRTGMNDILAFAVTPTRGFHEQLLATAPDPAIGKPDPVKMKAFLAAHPETVHPVALIKRSPVSSGFVTSSFNSLDAFRFVSTAGVSIPARCAPAARHDRRTAGLISFG